jgi:hypothetical protein
VVAVIAEHHAREPRQTGRATGINSFGTEITAKRLGLLRELVIKVARIGVL